MEHTISVRLEKSALKELNRVEKKWQTDRSEVIRRLLSRAIQEWKIENALEEIRERKISIGKAAEECGITIWEMLDKVKEKNIDWTNYSEEDLKRDLSTLG